MLAQVEVVLIQKRRGASHQPGTGGVGWGGAAAGPLYALPVQHKRPSKRLLRDNIRLSNYRIVVHVKEKVARTGFTDVAPSTHF